MKLETKFNIGQNVWFKPEGKEPFCECIKSIAIDVHLESGITIEYWAKCNTGTLSIFDESETFATKEEALK